MSKNIFITCLTVMLFTTTPVFPDCIKPDTGFWQNEQGRGWFWKQGECEIISKDNVTQNPDWKILPQTTNIPWNIIDSIDPEEIATKIEPVAKKISIMYPTEKNILEYRRLTNWIVAKASKYATIDERIRTENPYTMPGLDLSPTSAIKSQALVSYKNSEMDKILAEYKNIGGIIIYESATCRYCKLQKPIIEEFKNIFEWEVMYRDVALFAKETDRLDIKTTPDIFLVVRAPNNGGIKYQRIATGLTTLDALKTSIIKGLGYLGENINETLINY